MPVIRDLDVTVAADFAGNAIGVAVNGSSTASLRDAQINVSAAAAFAEGVLANSGPTTVTGSTVNVSASGPSSCQALAVNVFGAVDVVGSTLMAATTCTGGFSYGLPNQGSGTATIKESTVKAGTAAVFSSGSPVKV